MIEFREEGTRQKAGLQQQIPGEYSIIPSGICLDDSEIQENWLIFRDHLLQASKQSTLTITKMRKCQKACMDEKEATVYTHI